MAPIEFASAASAGNRVSSPAPRKVVAKENVAVNVAAAAGKEGKDAKPAEVRGAERRFASVVRFVRGVASSLASRWRLLTALLILLTVGVAACWTVYTLGGLHETAVLLANFADRIRDSIAERYENGAPIVLFLQERLAEVGTVPSVVKSGALLLKEKLAEVPLMWAAIAAVAAAITSVVVLGFIVLFALKRFRNKQDKSAKAA